MDLMYALKKNQMVSYSSCTCERGNKCKFVSHEILSDWLLSAKTDKMRQQHNKCIY